MVVVIFYYYIQFKHTRPLSNMNKSEVVLFRLVHIYSECRPRILIIIMFDLINCRFYSWRWSYLYCLACIIFVSSIFDVTTIWRTITAVGLTFLIIAQCFSIEIYTNAIMAYRYNYRIDWTLAATILWRWILPSTNHSRRYVPTNQRADDMVGLRSPCTRLFWGYIKRANCQFSSSCDGSKTSVDGDGFRECRALEQPNKE